MSTATKFTFDTVFDGLSPSGAPRDIPHEALAPGAAPADAPVEPEVEIPTFSEAELAAAREEGRAQGRAEGMQEQAAATEQQAADLINQVNTRLGELIASELAAYEERTGHAVAVALTIVRKMFPDLQEAHGLLEIETLVTRTLSELAEEPKVTLTLHPDAAETFRARLDGIAADVRFEGEIDIQVDPVLDISDCRIAWSRGGLERDTASLWQNIDEIIEKNLGGLPEVTRPAEPELDSEPPASATDVATDTQAPPEAEADMTNETGDEADGGDTPDIMTEPADNPTEDPVETAPDDTEQPGTPDAETPDTGDHHG